MSRGEITIEENQFKPATVAPGDWAAEYGQQYNGGQSWADQFAHEEASARSLQELIFFLCVDVDKALNVLILLQKSWGMSLL